MMFPKPVLWLSLAVIAGLSTGVFAGVTSTETASATFEVLNPGFDTTLDADLFLDQFDTQGGTRQLTAVDFLWTVEIFGSGTFIANTTQDTIGTQVEWETIWTGDLNGAPLPHTDASGHQFFLGAAIGEDSEPGDPAGAFDSTNIVAAGLDNGITDLTILSALTGAGQAHINGTLDISPAVEVPYGGALHDIFFPHVIFVPGYFTAHFDSYRLDLDATYHYVAVPAPGAAAILLLVAPMMTRRRRATRN